MKKFIVVEVGSTNTKASYYEEGIINYLGFKTIEFKSNFKKEGKILDSDKQLLFDYLKELKNTCNEIYVYGTSIFRDLSAKERKDWLEEFKNSTNLDFNIVSAKEENQYTTFGAFPNYSGSIAIMIAGGASTELSIFNEGKLVEQKYYNFGVTNALSKFPDLSADTVTSDYNTMLNEMRKLIIKKPTHKADILVLAGGDFIYFFEEAHYPLLKNNFYGNELEPYALDIETATEHDKNFFYNTSLDELCIRTNNEGWWRGTRGMRLCVKALCEELNAKYIVPTRINMVYGIVKEIIENNEVRN